ncbi:MAG: SDR family NAD(P)-dependent oxidoreductase [Chitinivibrionales bacterium]|nr:SDR family NAD(P)-dependent oxidoreductase [Chitinivibrionales bacterium]MBD3359068.1 SDR family NAD(P)-dependent oxidoreductase [Chitinivibrionales bacterium]
MPSTQRKTALITGASSGIGKELATIHAEQGGDLVVVARGKEALEGLKNDLETKHSINVYILIKDLSDSQAPGRIYDEVKEKGLTVDYLMNNAGFGGRGKFHERQWERDLAMIQVNVLALTALTRFFLPDFVNRNSGKILNVSSTAALVPGPLQAVYYATKSYVTSFSNALAEELHDAKVTVTALMPGATETQFAKVSGMDKTALFNKTFSARTVAKEGYNGMLAGKLNVFSAPVMQRVMTAAIPFIPRKMLLRTVRKMQEVKK